MTLFELFDVTWDITMVHIVARDDKTRFLHEWMIGEDISESPQIRYNQKEGKLTLKECKLNDHATRTRGGGTEIGWGVNKKMIPVELLTAPITHLLMGSRGVWKGTEVWVSVEIHPLTAAKIIPERREEDEGEQG